MSLTRAEADTFVYDDAARHAVYDTTALPRSEHGDLKTDTIEGSLETDGRTLDGLEVEAPNTTALLRSKHGDMKADTIEVFLETDGRTLDRLEATGTVTLGLDDRWATGVHLVYYEAEGRYEMEGAPVVIVEEIDPMEPATTPPPRPGSTPTSAVLSQHHGARRDALPVHRHRGHRWPGPGGAAHPDKQRPVHPADVLRMFHRGDRNQRQACPP